MDKWDKEIETFNSKGQYHGYQELYSPKGWLQVRGNSKNELDIGYQEFHGYGINSGRRFTIFCIE